MTQSHSSRKHCYHRTWSLYDVCIVCFIAETPRHLLDLWGDVVGVGAAIVADTRPKQRYAGRRRSDVDTNYEGTRLHVCLAVLLAFAFLATVLRLHACVS